MSAQTIELAHTFDVADFTDRYVPGTPLTEHQAQLLTQGILDTLATAQDLLRVAFAGKAHEVLGFGKGQAGWDAYYAEYFAETVAALPVAQRRLEVAKWNEAGASLGVTATALGVSKPTISEDRKHVGQPQNVVSLDGRRRDSVAASAAVVEAKAVAPKKRAVPLTQRIEAMLLEAGPEGLTSREALARVRGAHHGVVSPVFTALKQQHRVHLSGEKRLGYAVHVHPQHVVLDAEIVD